jgi:hypothetical protein
MIGIGIFFSVIGLGYLCWTLFDLMVCALPAIVGVTAGFAAYHSGAGVLGAVIVAPIEPFRTPGFLFSRQATPPLAWPHVRHVFSLKAFWHATTRSHR